jgi:hypothetical protein
MPRFIKIDFMELCESLYWEALRRGESLKQHSGLDCNALSMMALDLSWLPINLLNGIIRDVCSEIFRRFPGIRGLWAVQRNEGAPYMGRICI